MRKFPFDEQNCPITLSSWALSASMLDLTINKSSVMKDNFVDNPSWNLDDVSVQIKNNTQRFGYFFKDYLYQEVSVILNLSRRPLYFMINGVFPCFILNILTLLAFGLPATAQFSLSITIFLTFSVSAVRIASQIPVQSKYLPPIILYFLLSQLFTLMAFCWFTFDCVLRAESYIPRAMTWLGIQLRRSFALVKNSPRTISALFAKKPKNKLSDQVIDLKSIENRDQKWVKLEV